MTDVVDPHHPNLEPPPRLIDRLSVNRHGDGYAYRPGTVFLRENDAGALRRLGQLVSTAVEEEAPADPDDPPDDHDPTDEAEAEPTRRPFVRSLGIVKMVGVADAAAVAEQLVAEGFDAQPEHVLFAHADCGSGCGPHPADVHDLAADPFRANPFRANPFRANPFRANPFRANPFRANLTETAGPPTSSVMPAFARELPERTLDGPGRRPRVLVLDTGIAGHDGTVDTCPRLLARPATRSGPWRIQGVLDVADGDIPGCRATHPADGYIDPVAGHGTFIAGLIEQLAPGCAIRVEKVVGPLGDVDEGDVATILGRLVGRVAEQRPDIVSMSFGGHLAPDSFVLRQAVAAVHREGIVLVASAGNDGWCTPVYPAAFDHVVAVGAVGPHGPAPWTNYGPWVDACAPGVDLVSSFFSKFEGRLPMINGVDPDDFEEWARWSGTSFSVPVVVAALAREMVMSACDAPTAVDRVVHAPHLMRIPCLGTVVNI